MGSIPSAGISVHRDRKTIRRQLRALASDKKPWVPLFAIRVRFTDQLEVVALACRHSSSHRVSSYNVVPDS
jgi:hypothetical protein